jgi:aldehyde:ferredoxin oxidoreductase
MYGWMGQILNVNLTNLEITWFSTEPYAQQYLGGRGVASRIYWERVAPGVKAFDPENTLIFMTGPLIATGTQGATRLSVVGKSPMTLPEGFCYSSIGGFIGAELKKAGLDGVVITGRAQKPVYLWINDDKAEIRDASYLWGLGAYQVEKALHGYHGENLRYITTGPAGENLVRTAVAVASHHAVGSAGFGAVMGSKNLKAIVVRGTGKPSVFAAGRLTELNRYTVRISKRLHLAIPPNTMATGGDKFLEVIGKGKCYQCGLECIKNLYRYGGNLEGYRKCQSMEYYLPWLYSRKDEPVSTFFDAPALANDYSVCTFELQYIVNWLYKCYQSGYLTEQETGLPLSEIGTRNFLVKLIHSIAYREGFGDTLADGLVRVAERVPEKERALFGHTLAPICHHEEVPPRQNIINSLLCYLEPRVHLPLIHEVSFVLAAWAINQRQPEVSPVTTKVFRDIAKAFWGSEEAGDLSSYEGKALAAIKIQDRTYVKDSLGLCDFGWPITYSFNTPNYVGDPDLEGEIYSAVTGNPADEVNSYGETISSLQRAILIREGRNVPSDDFPSEYNFTEPLKFTALLRTRPLIVPGPGEEPVNMTGNTLDRGKFTRMLKEYYRLRGWKLETGVPRAETLAALGLGDLATSFLRQGERFENED